MLGTALGNALRTALGTALVAALGAVLVAALGANNGGSPSGAYVVFDPSSSTLYADALQNDGGYTVVATFEEGTPAAANVEII